MKIPYIVAEIGCNFITDQHQSREGIRHQIKKMIEVASECGCDSVKFQAFRAEDLKDAKDPNYDLLEVAELNGDEWSRIKDVAADCNIDWFASVFSKERLDYILQYDPIRWKTAAPDLVRGAEWAESTDVPWWASLDPRFYKLDKRYKLETAKKAEIVLACRSDYPAVIDDYELMAIGDDEIAGCSDHTLGLEFAGYMGHRYQVWEKHLTLDKNAEGPDHWLSLEPREMKRYVEIIHTAHGDREGELKRLGQYSERWV